MTTIAYRDGVMAADSQVTADDAWVMPYTAVKIRRATDGSLVGFSGNVFKFDAFMDWLEDNKLPRLDLGNESKVLVVSPAGQVLIYMFDGQIAMTGPFCAIGCGVIPATAAMHMGASAERAVEIAALIDNCTGGKIQVERL